MKTPNTPAEQAAHDARIADLSFERAKAQGLVDRQREYRDSDDGYTRHIFSADKLAAAELQVARLDAELEPLYEAYTGWPRYYHVQNNNGHVHTSTSCSSCYFDTVYSWRTDLSGLTPEQVVEREAYNACSVCMPIAPAEQKAARKRYTDEQRQAKQTERQAAKDAKFQKALALARKHADKVAKALCDLTGESDLNQARIVFERDWSTYGHDGRKGVSQATYDLPTKVGDSLHFMSEHKDNPGKRALYEPSAAVKQALTEKGLID